MKDLIILSSFCHHFNNYSKPNLYVLFNIRDFGQRTDGKYYVEFTIYTHSPLFLQQFCPYSAETKSTIERSRDPTRFIVPKLPRQTKSSRLNAAENDLLIFIIIARNTRARERLSLSLL